VSPEDDGEGGFRSHDFCLLVQNVQGLTTPNKIVLFKDFLQNLESNEKPHIIALTETWLNNLEGKSLNLLNYKTAAFFGRSERARGGVSILIRRDLSCEEICLDSFEYHVEFASLIVHFGLEKFLLLNVYRPSNPENNVRFSSFFGKLEAALVKLIKIFKRRKLSKFIVCGDFNINMNSSNANAARLLNLMSQFNFVLSNGGMVTRFNDSSGTLLDLIFEFSQLDSYCYSLSNLFSDHESVICRQSCSELKKKDVIRFERSFGEENFSKFQNYLLEQSWIEVVSEPTVDGKYDMFLSVFLRGFHECFPERRKVYRANQVGKIVLPPWLKALKREILDLGILIRSVISVSDKKRLRKMLKIKKLKFSSGLKAEILRVNNEFILNASNKSRAAWQVINKTIGNVQQESLIQELRSPDGTISTNSMDIAGILNSEFVLPAPSELLIPEIPDYNVLNALFLSPISDVEVLHYIRMLPNKKSCGYDGVPMFLVKRVASLIAAPLAHVFSFSFEQGVYPVALKQAVVVPLFKKGDKLSAKNYRPISNLPSFSKVLENCFLSRLTNFFQSNNLLPPSQHGFLKGRSTMTALYEYLNEVYSALQKKSKVLSIFFDLTNAFGTICTGVLLAKLEKCGVRGLALQWLESALSDRSQKVKLKCFEGNKEVDVFSELLSIQRGTPQGGIISPFLFDVAVIDLALALLVAFVTCYADDTTALVVASNTSDLFANAQMAAQFMSDYCRDNYLSLNSAKTAIMCFRSPYSSRHLSSPYVNISGKSVECVQSAKLLGLYLMENLSWADHGNHVIGKLSSAVFMVNSLRKSVDDKYIKMVYYAHAYSAMQYGVIFWGCSPSVLNAVFVAQKRVVRAMAGERFWPGPVPLCSARPLFKKLNLLPVFSIYLLESCKFVRSFPKYFGRNRGLHEHDTRRRNDLHVPAQSTAFSKSSPHVCMVNLYNLLPASLKNESQFTVFLKRLKSLVYNQRFYDFAEFEAYVTR
jgi:exonuclease III